MKGIRNYKGTSNTNLNTYYLGLADIEQPHSQCLFDVCFSRIEANRSQYISKAFPN